MRFSAVGFDLGETLVHYAGLPLSWQALYPQALVRVADACGHSITKTDLVLGETILAHYNTRLRPRLEEVKASRVLGEVLAAWEMSRAADMEQVEDAFFGFFQQTYAVYSDTLLALQEFRKREVKIGVLTDVPYGMPSRFVDRDLEPIASHIDLVLTSVEVGYRKPHSRGYLSLAEGLAVKPSTMIYIGNEEKDIVGANDEGLFSVLIDRAGNGANFGQKRTIASLSELTLFFTN